jgi:hypothetical protein
LLANALLLVSRLLHVPCQPANEISKKLQVSSKRGRFTLSATIAYDEVGKKPFMTGYFNLGHFKAALNGVQILRDFRAFTAVTAIVALLSTGNLCLWIVQKALHRVLI